VVIAVSLDIVMALHVTNRELYSQYRTQMKPLLEAAGGRFRYDFEIGRTLANSSGHAVNRVFVIAFPDAPARDRFFADPQYRAIRSALFDRAVGAWTVIGELHLL
jgi:uncharacterized protein (DUF1330 family)